MRMVACLVVVAQVQHRGMRSRPHGGRGAQRTRSVWQERRSAAQTPKAGPSTNAAIHQFAEASVYPRTRESWRAQTRTGWTQCLWAAQTTSRLICAPRAARCCRAPGKTAPLHTNTTPGRGLGTYYKAATWKRTRVGSWRVTRRDGTRGAALVRSHCSVVPRSAGLHRRVVWTCDVVLKKMPLGLDDRLCAVQALRCRQKRSGRFWSRACKQACCAANTAPRG